MPVAVATRRPAGSLTSSNPPGLGIAAAQPERSAGTRLPRRRAYGGPAQARDGCPTRVTRAATPAARPVTAMATTAAVASLRTIGHRRLRRGRHRRRSVAAAAVAANGCCRSCRRRRQCRRCRAVPPRCDWASASTVAAAPSWTCRRPSHRASGPACLARTRPRPAAAGGPPTSAPAPGRTGYLEPILGRLGVKATEPQYRVHRPQPVSRRPGTQAETPPGRARHSGQ